MGINLKIASRFLKSSKAQTTLIVLGIALGVTVQIFLGLLIKNLNNDQINQIVGNTSQITINNKENSSKVFENYDNIINTIKKDYPQISEITGVLDTPGIITKGTASTSILVRGMEFGQGNNIYGVQKDLVKGNMPAKADQVVIGEGIAKKYGYTVGDKITFSQPNMTKKTVVVSGIANFEVAQLNNSWMVTNLNYAQSLFNEKGKVNSIEMKLYNKDIFTANTIASGIQEKINSSLQVTNWKETNPGLLNALSGQSSSSMTIQVFIIISVAMSIAGVLAVSVMQKSKQIGILKAMGIKNRGAAAIFIYQGGILGVIGSIVGGILGVGLFELFSNAIKTPSGAPIVTGHVYIGYLAVSMIIAIVVAIIAAVFAASKSLKLDPMEVIRNN